MTCYNFFEMLIFAMFFLGLYHNLYERSISTFISVSSLFAFVVSHRYMNESCAYLILCFGIIIMYSRAMYKKKEDTIVTWK